MPTDPKVLLRHKIWYDIISSGLPEKEHPQYRELVKLEEELAARVNVSRYDLVPHLAKSFNEWRKNENLPFFKRNNQD